jgi:hypothetical protein
MNPRAIVSRSFLLEQDTPRQAVNRRDARAARDEDQFAGW